MNLAKESKISLLVVTVCYVLLGLVLLFCPQFTVVMLCYAVGGISVVYGVSRVVDYVLRQPNWDEPYRFDLVTGIVFAGGGLYAILQSDVVAGFLGTLMGLAVCLDSLVKLQTAIDLQRLGSRVWLSVLVLAMVTGTLGGLLFFYQGTGILSVLQFLGICLVIDGCVNIWSFTFLAMSLSRLHKARQAQAAASASNDAAQARPSVPDEEVRTGVLTAFDALKKKFSSPGDAQSEANADASAKCAMDEPAKAAVLLLKPTQEELGVVASAPASLANEDACETPDRAATTEHAEVQECAEVLETVPVLELAEASGYTEASEHTETPEHASESKPSK